MRGEELYEILPEIFQKSQKKESQKQKHAMIVNFICSRAHTASTKPSMGFDSVSPGSHI